MLPLGRPKLENRANQWQSYGDCHHSAQLHGPPHPPRRGFSHRVRNRVKVQVQLKNAYLSQFLSQVLVIMNIAGGAIAIRALRMESIREWNGDQTFLLVAMRALKVEKSEVEQQAVEQIVGGAGGAEWRLRAELSRSQVVMLF
ncbi:hypothetical protein EZV62_007680 [Acer yangbiense]|uniref:Uncharacterized protein n=1 Tax=Acer yangbiense TaxID=1000413 RepID=A0A5C7IAY8_9ROSI|nr:hypothetical protein EZV62_007680 [Acer yangbiense]